GCRSTTAAGWSAGGAGHERRPKVKLAEIKVVISANDGPGAPYVWEIEYDGEMWDSDTSETIEEAYKNAAHALYYDSHLLKNEVVRDENERLLKADKEAEVAKTQGVIEYVVQANDFWRDFPIDMLRYDGSWPASEPMSAVIRATMREPGVQRSEGPP